MNVKFNVLGIDLSHDEISAVLDIQNQHMTSKREWLAHFFQLDQSELTIKLLSRYVEADQKMIRITCGSIHEDINIRIFNVLASAKRCYCYGEFLACIELCALHGEMIANYLCITNKSILISVLDKLSDDDQSEIREKGTADIYFSDKLGQTLRLRWLLMGSIITKEDKKALSKIHGIRIEYFHHWSSKSKYQNDALMTLCTMSPVTSKFLELIGKDGERVNQANIKRIRVYMDLVADPQNSKD